MDTRKQGLGDAIAKALGIIGVTQDRVTYWLGDCCCQERQDKLNQLGNWASRVISHKLHNAKEYLDAILHNN